MSSTQQLLLGEGAGGGGAGAPVYIEDVFSTYLYTGTSANQSITNGIDLAGKGGLVWIKARNLNVDNVVFDSARGEGASGNYKQLFTNSTSAQTADPNNGISSFDATGFSLTNNETTSNRSPYNYVSWTFREQPKFFDVVTYTGNASARTIAHNLGSAPGCIMVKCTSEATDWWVYHRSLGTNQVIKLNTTAAQDTSATAWNNTAPTSTVFSIGDNGQVNSNGQTYVAYLFAHNAGGFGLAGTDNVISCGSLTTNSSGTASVTLGYEPQWVLVKSSSAVNDWQMVDAMRGFPVGDNSAILYPNSTSTESSGGSRSPNATGFTWAGLVNTAHIYIAIRRGPMKVPTVGTSVFAPVLYSGTDTITNVTTNIVPSLTIVKGRSNISSWYWTDMLRGSTNNLRSNTTGGQQYDGQVTPRNTGFTLSVNNGFTNAGVNFISYSMLRAPKFFDEVCYTGTGSGTTFAHNLTVVPELMIVKRTSGTEDWAVYSSALGNNKALTLNADTSVLTTTTYWSSSTPTSSVFTVGSAAQTNASGATYVNYLFATLAGVSKVGSYVGNGVDTTIDCGFVDGARLVLIKSTSFADNWAIFDSARGYASASDPYLALNAADAESTGNWLLFRSEGFGVRSSSFVGGSLNVSGQSYIFLAIA